MQKHELPKTNVDLAIRIGVYEVQLKSLEQVRAAQLRLSELMVDAAEERWPDFLSAPRAIEEAHKMVWENALALWPKVATLYESLHAAEVYMLRNARPMA